MRPKRLLVRAWLLRRYSELGARGTDAAQKALPAVGNDVRIVACANDQRGAKHAMINPGKYRRVKGSERRSKDSDPACSRAIDQRAKHRHAQFRFSIVKVEIDVFRRLPKRPNS